MKLLLSLSLFLLTSLSVFAHGLVSLKTFDKEHIYFKPDANHREASTLVSFPDPDFRYEKVIMKLKLECPNQKCDHWDRRAHLSLTDESNQTFEIFRFVTPYRVGQNWEVDLTDFSPLFSGNKTLNIMIDTWVGPGHPQGEGWLVTVSFDFYMGHLEHRPIKVVPIMTMESIVYGDPEKDPTRTKKIQIGDELYSSFSHIKVKNIITGHGQGNTENCAEFCPKNHTLKLNDVELNETIWRSDCSKNPTPGQYGTWWYPRAGFCPGDQVFPWNEIVEKSQITSQEFEITYKPQDYVNEKRFDYNNNGHTEPHYYVSSYLIFFN